MRVVTIFLLLSVIYAIEAAQDIICEVKVREDPFDSGFQKERTSTVLCEFDVAIEIATPTKLLNSVNESVIQLHMSNNKKIEFLPQDVSVPFPNLRVINAFGCSIKSVNKRNFQGLTKVVKIDLQDNNLETIEENSFDDLVNLSNLYLDNNKIANLPLRLFEKLGHLDTLYLKNNLLTNLDVNLFKNNKEIALLHLSENKLQTLPSGIFDGFKLLRQLWLKGNEIQELPANIFNDCENLVDIDLSGNKIKFIDSNLLSKVTSLREVLFSFNPLDFIDISIFEHNKDLVMFYFNGVGTKDIRHIERVDQMKNIQGIGFHDTCVNGQFHEGNLDKLKEAVNSNCKV